jgi:hypothetical protein
VTCRATFATNTKMSSIAAENVLSSRSRSGHSPVKDENSIAKSTKKIAKANSKVARLPLLA